MKVTVIGAGSWGTALSILLAENGHNVALWARSPGLCRDILEKRENQVYLPGAVIPATVAVTASLKDALKNAEGVVSCVPSHGLRSAIKDAAPHIPEGSLIVSASKGIEETTLLTSSGILKELLPPSFHENIVILSGPTFAKEVSLRLPAAACAAGRSKNPVELAQKIFSNSYFRVYTNFDPAGVELGGALKNVMAIAAGISDGLGLGSNARAALITRGLKEITSLGQKMGADPRTLYGLSGLGDLVLTCTGVLSRNHKVGFEIGMGRKLKDITADMRMVAEGVKTASGVRELSKRNKVGMPITEAVYEVLYEDKPPRDAVMELMIRELKGEL